MGCITTINSLQSVLLPECASGIQKKSFLYFDKERSVDVFHSYIVCICVNTYMYTCGGGRELLLESIRTVPTECFNNNAQYKTILTRMQIP